MLLVILVKQREADVPIVVVIAVTITTSITTKFLNHSGIGSWFTELIQATSSFKNDERIVWISIEGLLIKAWTPNTFCKIASLWGEYVEWEDADLKSMSELDAWFLNFQKDDKDDLSSDGESQEGDVANKSDNNESDVDRVLKSSFMHENDTAHKDVNSCKKGEKSKVGGSILDLMDELVTVSQTMSYNMAGLGNKAKRRWIKELRQKHRINSASIQETKAESISLHTIKDLWGNQMFDHVVGSSVGCSGSILCMWKPNMFVKEKVSTYDYFVALMDQVQDLERIVTYEEDKRVVWDCGTNKSPGPDGFSFEFYPFVANRQILDGPFILNELLSWCKFKKLNWMIFKVDFEKDFDSVKWDYLDETLKAFGFGSKWRNWISSCLNNAMGSVLVNGSPTLEFQFHKGLKQGIGVSSNVVAVTASLIGCSILTAPFNYLGVKVGSNMSRITSWDDVISKNFFYGVDGSDRKLAWIGWNMVLTSKKNGGLGVSSFFAHNRALDTHKLIPRRSPWQDVIFAIHSLQSKGEVPLKVLYKRLYALEMCKSISVAEKMGHPSLSHSFRRMPRGGVEQENYSLLCSKFADLMLPNISDRWCWFLECSQEFSVKSSRILIDNTIFPKAKVPTR
nr:RNA-directed DNA polymerase, eukaryota [Tanacetum cinerariifolium]